MKKIILLFCSDFKEFLRNNWKILIICLVTVFVIQYNGKGSLVTNISVITIHIIGDVMMIISLTKYSKGEKKSGYAYMSSSVIFFIIVGAVAVIQSTDGKNWQYLLGTAPFLVANIYQLFDAWEIKGKRLFNYKMTMLATIVLAFLYYKMDLVYSHTWVQIVGYSMFPIFLGMQDSPKVFLARIFSVFIMLIGVLIDIAVQSGYPGVIPASSLSSFFITLIAFFGFINNAQMYVEKVNKDNFFTRKTLRLLMLFNKAN